MASLAQRLFCGYYCLSDVAVGLGRAAGLRSLGSGKRHARYMPERSAEYIRWCVDLFAGILGEGAFRGDVCEIGPGDSLGAGVLYCARGARSVTFFERFQSALDPERERTVAELLAAGEGVSTENGSHSPENVEALLASFRVVAGVPAEKRLREDRTEYDLILSNSVMQHVTDPLPLLQLCYERLRPGGRMVHVIDLRPLGVLQSFGELAWLETSPGLHRRMVRHTGRPNRVRFDEYRRWAERSGGECRMLIRNVVGHAEALGDIEAGQVPAGIWEQSRARIEAARPRFAPALRGVSADDLAVATFILCLNKPA